MQPLICGVVGLLFGLGLIISGMTDPNRVLAFLDVAGDWSPLLILVMASAIAIALPAYSYYKRRGVLFNGITHPLPETRTITRSLVIGSSIFGIGWGLSGICPGPAVVLVGSGNLQGIIFTVGMVAGIVGHAFFESRVMHKKSPRQKV